MAKKFLCDCCGEEVTKGRVTGRLGPIKDLCSPCYQGFINLSKVVKLTDKDILKRLDMIVRASNGRR